MLSKIYLQDEITVRSTDKERTKMTAQLAMAAVYPPEVDQQWDDGLGKLWQPVPYTAVPLAEDYVRFFFFIFSIFSIRIFSVKTLSFLLSSHLKREISNNYFFLIRRNAMLHSICETRVSQVICIRDECGFDSDLGE